MTLLVVGIVEHNEDVALRVLLEVAVVGVLRQLDHVIRVVSDSRNRGNPIRLHVILRIRDVPGLLRSNASWERAIPR